MRTKSTEREAREGTNDSLVRSRPSPESGTHESDDATTTILDLQQSHGNRHVQRVLSSAAAESVPVAGEEEKDENEGGAQTAAFDFAGAAAALGFSGPPTLVEVELEPHRGSAAELRALAPFYRAGRTPYYDTEGTLRTFEVAPADAATTAHQLSSIHQRYGDDGIAQTFRGLSLTRGTSFASQVLQRTSPSVGGGAHAANVDEGESEEPMAARAATAAAPTPAVGGGERTAGHDVARVMEHAGAGSAVPSSVRRLVGRLTGDRLTDVRVHNDAAAHAAADMLNARAFTVGRSIYFAPGEFSPASASGRRLLAHELAHTVQQRGTELPSLADLRVSSASDIEESHAEQVADAAARGGPRRTRLARAGGRRFARVQRAISFKRDNDAFIRNRLVVNEDAGGFTVDTNTLPLFSWFADVEIKGNAGDPFSNFEAGPHQVVRAFRGAFTWGTGASRARRVITVVPLPIRDAIDAGNTWYHEPFAVSFAANGDKRNTGLRDSPSPGTQPWVSPVAGKGGTTGTLAFTSAFVAYISARDTTKGTGAAAMTALNCLYWNSSISGSFDTSQAVGSRVTSSGGNVNKGGIISGGAAEFPSMHGGPIANDNLVTTDT